MVHIRSEKMHNRLFIAVDVFSTLQRAQQPFSPPASKAAAVTSTR